MKFKKIPSGVEKIIIKRTKKINPYCSIAIIFSVLIGKNVKSIFDPSSGGKGMRLKNAKSTFQKITIMSRAKNMEPNEFETASETCCQEVPATPKIMALLTATEMGIIFAITAATSEIKILEPGPPSATISGPHF